MTQPVQESSSERNIGGLDWRTRQLARRPAPVSTGCCPAWMAVFDNFYWGQDISTTDGATNLEYPYCDWSDNAAGIFDWVRAPGTFAPNTYNIQLLVDGIYTITSWLVSEDLSVSNYEIRQHIDTGMGYPGRGFGSDLTDREIITADFQDAAGTARSYSAPYVYLSRSWTLPLQRFFGNPGTVYPYVLLLRPATAPDYSMTLRNRLWIIYHGPLEHTIGLTAGDHENYSPYDATGGPIHPPDHTTSN